MGQNGWTPRHRVFGRVRSFHLRGRGCRRITLPTNLADKCPDAALVQVIAPAAVFVLLGIRRPDARGEAAASAFDRVCFAFDRLVMRQ